MKVKLDVDEVKEIHRQWDEINKLNVEDIELYKNGEQVIIPSSIIEEWRFVGLGLGYFIVDELYKEENWADG